MHHLIIFLVHMCKMKMMITPLMVNFKSKQKKSEGDLKIRLCGKTLDWYRNMALNVANVDSVQIIRIETTLLKYIRGLYLNYVDLRIFSIVA